jgi:hypothetical protein
MSSEMLLATGPLKVRVDALVEAHRPLVDPARPASIRLRVAKGLLPATIEDLVPTLTYLAGAEDDAIATAARETLCSMPSAQLAAVCRSSTSSSVLDALARILPDSHEALPEVTVSRVVADATLIHLAGIGGARICDQIARNTVRCLAQPSIVEALFFNPKAPPGQVQNLLEFAVREGADLEHIPGYIEMRAAILGERGAEKDNAPGLSDIEFLTAVSLSGGRAGLTDEQLEAIEGREGEEGEDDDDQGGSLQALISRMSVAQKIRLALVGDANARKLLIRDPKKMVALAVLKSPRVTDGEVRMFAQNKSLGEEILTQICRNKSWTRDYGVRKSLVLNPKTPIAMSMGFLRTLTARDIKEVSKSRDVSSVIARQAKRILDQQEQARRGKR